MRDGKFGGRPPRLERVFQRFPVWFVTFNTARHRPCLSCPSVHDAFVDFARRAHGEHCIAVGRYVIMPDHVHLFVTGFSLELGKWVKMLKQVLAKHLPLGENACNVWQQGFFDHLLRSGESYAQKWEYVRQNPVRAGLVAHWEQWPWQGEIVIIEM